jgi:LysM repeat protein
LLIFSCKNTTFCGKNIIFAPKLNKKMKKFLLLLAVTAFSYLTSNAQIRWNERYQQYINQYKDIAIEEMQRWKIPASITLAQGLFESGAGQSELARKGNNHFGIKCNGWTGRKVYHDDDERNECFRAYDSAYESYEDHSRFLASSQRYRSLFDLKVTDYKNWAKGLKAAGYATNPQYASKLIEIIQLYKLYEYDTAKSADKFMVEHAKDHRVNGQDLHPIKIFNKNYYLIARRGDTFKTIAEEIGISYRKLAKYNERDKNDRLDEGEIIWLKKKQTKAPKDYKGRLHYIRNGESMYSIAQMYGIRLKNLYKMNKLSPDYQIHVGDALRLR